MSELPSSVVIVEDPAQVLVDYDFSAASQVFVLVDQNTRQHCYPLLENLPDHKIITIDAGEEYKTLDTCQVIWSELTEHQADRHSLLINLGGGVIGDMGGFCAATFKRGISFINIPTTLLAQVDASVGGKLGIDFKGLKNHLGIFQQPDHVSICPAFFHSLSQEELLSGYAEVLKHALIYNKEEWERLVQMEIGEIDWVQTVTRSVKIKSQIADADPKERGMRKILNFGHTVGHAVETYLLNTGQKIPHGWAVALGMIIESYLSEQRTGLNSSAFERIREKVLNLYPFGRLELDLKVVKDLMKQDKKNKGGIVLFSLLSDLGKGVYNVEIPDVELEKGLAKLNDLTRINHPINK